MSKVVKIALNFGCFQPKFCRGYPLKNQCTCYHPVHPSYEPHHLVKFREVTSTTPKVTGANMWNFKPNFKYSALKFLETPTQFVVCASKPQPVSSACKNLRGQRPLGAEIQYPDNHLGVSTCASITLLLVDQSSSNFLHLIGDEMLLIKYFSDFRQVDPFLRYLRSNSKVVKNRTEFCTFLPPKFYRGHRL